MNTISEAEYQQNFVNIAIIIGIALVLSAIGGKIESIGSWLLGLLLAAFVLFEGVYYSKNKQFFSYGIAPGKAGS